MKKIAIFGGTFDPFHVGHKAIVKQLFDYVGVEEVIISPTVTNWYRNKDDVWLTDNQRIDVIYKATNDLSQVHTIGLNTYDLQLKYSFDKVEDQEEFVKNWHFYDTLVDLRARYGTAYNALYNNESEKTEFYVVIGADQLEFFKNWYRWEDILKLSKLIVVNNRNGKHVESDIPHIDIEIDKEFWNVSATEIRAKYKTMKDGYEKYLRTFDPPQVEKLIKRTPIFDLVSKPAPYEDKPEFRPVGINAPDWVTVIVEKEGQYCCVKQLRYGLMKECEEFIAGQVDEGEQALYAAKRELLEETGIHLTKGVSELQYLGNLATNPAFMNNHMHYFYVNLDTASWVQEKQDLDENEKLEVYWKDKNTVIEDYLKEHTSVFMAGGLWLMNKKGIN